MNKAWAEEEFKRQTIILTEKGYPKYFSKSDAGFLNMLEPLKEEAVLRTKQLPDMDKGCLPFVIVLNVPSIPPKELMSLVIKNKKRGIAKLNPLKGQDFGVIDDIVIPAAPAYLLIDIDRGGTSLNITPGAALDLIKEDNRSPLTINEGIAIITLYPEYLMKNHCFSLLASRHQADKKVPAIWINSNKNPNLGWCWEGNPHTWLGSASCKTRISA